jgi:hypothetical protein
MLLRSPVDMVILWGDQGLMIYETYPHPRGRPPAPMLDQMPGFAAVLTGPAHVFAYVNDAYRQIGDNRDYLGRSAREVFPSSRAKGSSPTSIRSMRRSDPHL